jgi:hypothetical protein
MPKLPKLKGKELIKILSLYGFDVIRIFRGATTSSAMMTAGAPLFPCILEKHLAQGCSFKFLKTQNSIEQICWLSNS